MWDNVQNCPTCSRSYVSSENQPRRHEKHEEKTEESLRAFQFFVVDFIAQSPDALTSETRD
jgi:hypothetical protein